jgi:hypothetical protein
MPKTSTPKPVKVDTKVPASVAPEITKKVVEEELENIFIDPEMVGKGGIRVNGKIFIGHIKVPKSIAEDLLRIQEEYWETVKKLTDKNISVRMKNDFQKEALFLADPNENANKKGFTKDYGLLPQREFLFCKSSFQQHLLDLRKQLYGY